MTEELTPQDTATVTDQLGRPPRSVAAVAFRCPCGKPAVLATRPRLSDGTPFPTTFYLTCPTAVARCSRLEATGTMTAMASRLGSDPELADRYRSAHRAYLDARAGFGDVPEIAGVSAGGMPDRVKCLHALVGHALAAGPGVNPLGDEALTEIGPFWEMPCLSRS